KSYRDSLSGQIQTELREKLKAYFGKRHAFLFYDGKTAIAVLLKSLLQNGSVLTPAYNCIAVPQAIQAAGFAPRFVDARPGRLDADPRDFRNAIRSDTQLLMPVHLFGIPWWIDELCEMCSDHQLPIVEDAAPALGARRNGLLVGSRGDAMVLSFHWTKPLSGETGGAVLTDDDEIADRIRGFSDQNMPAPGSRGVLFLKTWLRKSVCVPCVFGLARVGHRLLFGQRMFEVVANETGNGKTAFYGMPPFSCALVLNQLDRLDAYCGQRRQAAGIYQRSLQNNPHFSLPVIPDGSEPSWTQYPVLVDQKLGFFLHMQRHGIDVTWSYRYSCPDTFHMQGFENSGRVAQQIVSLPTWPGLRPDEMRRIAEAAAEYSLN
ncbi:MAG: DegT/DnrJ/EryC1/StrS family aminotransferase, partial [Anaerolineaceae bacterium]